MQLSADEMMKCDRIREFVLKTNSKERLEEIKCPRCKGTGLENTSAWDSNFCNVCNGVGFFANNDVELGVTFFICEKCNGYGCNHCREKGILTWLGKLFGDNG